MATADTPLMQQYNQFKQQYPDHLLFFRLGDFYELFGADAVLASDILGLTLTKRRSSKPDDEGVPMCGVPHHAAEGYIAKLLQVGHKVALCEQMESPAEAKKRAGSKALVKRAVTRLFTGGTLTEDTMLNTEQNNYLLALAAGSGQLAAAWVDISTGEFITQRLNQAELPMLLARLSPAEIVLARSLLADLNTPLKPFAERCTARDDTPDKKTAESLLAGQFENLKPSDKATTLAIGLVLDYIQQTQCGKLPTLQPPQEELIQQQLQLDAQSRRNLELFASLNGDKRHSLFYLIDRTVTPGGKRLLHQWLSAPLAELKPLETRQQAITALNYDQANQAYLQDYLKQGADISRALGRLTLGRGGPRDLAALSQTLTLLPQLAQHLAPVVTASEQNNLLKAIHKRLSGFEKLAATLRRAMKDDDLPLQARDGGFIQPTYCEQLAAALDLAHNGREKLQALETAEAKRTDIQKLRVKYNKVWGYFFEVTKSQVDKVPEDFIHRQTTTNAQRFSTTTLMELERKLGVAEREALDREQEIYTELVTTVCQQAAALLQLAQALALLDVLMGGARLTQRADWVVPLLTEGDEFIAQKGRHPVVAALTESFIANNCDLSDQQFWLITGPNMAGKSTFLRQQALITILAQIGYPVPAEEATIGLVDKIFTRIGAADDLTQGQSTFMVEMLETATILKQATQKSLVILDEIGRGTATYDGLAIAQACVEHLLQQTQCRGLFATHYHELTTLADNYGTLSNHHAAVKEWRDKITFLHEIKPGAAPGSYGVQVAQLAGVPADVVKRAQQLLASFEQESQQSAQRLPLFQAPATPSKAEPHPVITELEQLNLDDLTPREAHALLAKWQKT